MGFHTLLYARLECITVDQRLAKPGVRLSETRENFRLFPAMSSDPSLTYVHALLKAMLEAKASDLFISADFPPAMKIDGQMTPVT
jgi:hypothetical protein